jgi:hypothetical protein
VLFPASTKAVRVIAKSFFASPIASVDYSRCPVAEIVCSFLAVPYLQLWTL